MHYVFGSFSLYPDRAELIGPEGVVKVEPKAFAVLRHLVDHHDRVVSREELIASIWGGRFISDAAVATALKGARRAVGDDGARQAMIRTVHGTGHRFVGTVECRVEAAAPNRFEDPTAPHRDSRPTLAILPLAQGPGDEVQVGEGLSDEIIASLSRLRWLRVIARESSFRFRQETVDLDGIRRVLGAGYVLSGRVEYAGGRLAISVTLIDTRDGSVIWADRFTQALDDQHAARHGIVDAVVGALDLQIPQAEAAAARGKPSEVLDAWGAYHLGLSHMHRFNLHDNAIAQGLFQRATTLDPGFAVAYAAWSFTRFQDALQFFQPDRDAIVADVRRLAERAVELDPLDPFANLSLGRWYWLAGVPDDGLDWCDRAIRLSPSHSKSHYSRGFLDAFAGRADAARTGVDIALRLSPLDPMVGPMYAAKGLAYLVEGDHPAARNWMTRAARYSPSHTNVLIGSMAACQLAGDSVQAAHWATVLQRILPGVTVSMYLQSIPLADPAARARIRQALNAVGMPD